MSNSENTLPQAFVSDRLARLCGWGRIIAAAAIVVVIAWLTYLAFHPEEIIAELMLGLSAPESPPSALADAAAKLLGIAPALLFLFGLQRLIALFGEIASGFYFAPRTQALFVLLGRLTLIGSVLSIVVRTAAIALYTSGNPPNKKMLSITLSSGEISGLILACCSSSSPCYCAKWPPLPKKTGTSSDAHHRQPRCHAGQAQDAFQNARGNRRHHGAEYFLAKIREGARYAF